MSLLLQRIADRADSAVHHVRGRNDIGAGCGVGKRLLNQRIHGFVVGDIIVLIQQTVLAVTGVRIQRHIGNHAELGQPLFQCPYRALNEPLRIPCFPAIGGLLSGIDDGKQHHGGNSQIRCFTGLLDQLIDALAVDPRH